jgi:hypothetical protein
MWTGFHFCSGDETRRACGGQGNEMECILRTLFHLSMSTRLHIVFVQTNMVDRKLDSGKGFREAK